PMSARLLWFLWSGRGCDSCVAAFTELGRRNDGFDEATVYVVHEARDDELGREEGVRLDRSDVNRRIVGKAGDTAVSVMQHDQVPACGCSTFGLGDGPQDSHRLQRRRGVAATQITDD